MFIPLRIIALFLRFCFSLKNILLLSLIMDHSELLKKNLVNHGNINVHFHVIKPELSLHIFSSHPRSLGIHWDFNKNSLDLSVITHRNTLMH